MQHKYKNIIVAGIFLLAGTGCRDSAVPSINTKPADSLASTTEQIVNGTTTPEKSLSSITLNGQALGKRLVQFTWTLPEGAKDPEAFHLVRSQRENPTQPPGYWFAQPGTSRDAIWVKLPLGEQHFRICTWEAGKCGVYSNDVMVIVK